MLFVLASVCIHWKKELLGLCQELVKNKNALQILFNSFSLQACQVHFFFSLNYLNLFRNCCCPLEVILQSIDKSTNL